MLVGVVDNCLSLHLCSSLVATTVSPQTAAIEAGQTLDGSALASEIPALPFEDSTEDE